MDFICSRPAVPQTVAAMKAGTWFVLWKHRGAPFGKLDRGSQLWLYETKSRQIRWKSRITKCVEFNYASKAQAATQIKLLGHFDQEQSYFVNAPDRGVGLAWRVEPLEQVAIPRPTTLKQFPQRGWLPCSDSVAKKWLVAADLRDDTELAPEGQLRTHQTYERNPQNRERKLAAFRHAHGGRIFCECCGFDFEQTYGARGAGFIEVHHKIPVSSLRSGRTGKLSDLCLLCANCHRMVHREQPWLTLAQLKAVRLTTV